MSDTEATKSKATGWTDRERVPRPTSNSQEPYV